MSLHSYVKSNNRALVIAFAAGFAAVLLLEVFRGVLAPPFNWLHDHRPSLTLLIVFLLLIFIGCWPAAKQFWKRYKNSHRLSRCSLNWIDGLGVGIVPVVIWLLISFPKLLSSSYFWWPVGLLIFYGIGAFLAADNPDRSADGQVNARAVGGMRLLADDPLSDGDSDLIGRETFATALKDNIYNLSFRESFVLGLYGNWGEGKTSVLNMLKRKIVTDRKMLLYDFDPWFFANQDAITENFFHGLENSLAQDYFIPRRLKAHFKLYPELLVKGFIGMSLNLSDYEEDRPEQLRKEIENFLERLGKRVLVVIDDVDRLQKEEMLAVFKLVKLTSRVKNLVFLLSFDPAIVSNVLGEDGGEAEDYIEKIIQLPVYLPMTDQSKIDKFLLYSFPEKRSEIDKILDGIEIEDARRKEFDDEFVKTYQTTINQLFPTFRAAKRYLNSIMFRLPLVEREVFLYDFFLIELFQTFFPEVYADIRTHGWYYVSNWTLATHALSPLPYDEKERTEAIKQHIEGIIADNKDKDLITSLLEILFPAVRGSLSSSRRWRTHTTPHDDEYRRQKRIAHPDCFPKYFMLGVREGVIPDAEVEDEMAKWKASTSPEKEIEESLFGKYQKAGKLVDLLERLKLLARQIDGKLALPIIHVIYENCAKLSRAGDLWVTEFDQAEGLIFRILEDNETIKPDDIQGVLAETVEKAACFDLASLVVLSVNESHTSSLYRVHQNVRPDELRDLLERRLRDHYVKGKNDIFTEYRTEREFGFILYQWATRWGDKVKNNRAEVTKYLMGVFNKKPKELGYFLTTFAKPQLGHRERNVFDVASFAAAYEIEKFRRRIVSRGKSPFYSNKEEKEAIDLFVAAYKEWIKTHPPSVPIKKLAAAGRLSTKQYAIPMEWSDLEVFDAMQQALAGHVSDIIRIQADSNGVVAVAFDSSETKAQLEQLLNSVNFYEHGWNRGGVQGGEPGASFTVTAAKRS